MDDKNLEALTYGPKWMLAKFANLCTDSTSADVQEFCETYGDLYPGWDADSARDLYAYYVGGFQLAWDAKNRATRALVSKFITDIFEQDILAVVMRGATAEKLGRDPDNPESRPAIVADFESGKITVRPRTLLDWLAKSLLDYRDELAICKRENCENPYFVKTHARQRFCSPSCANQVRKQKKERWWAKNRDKFLKKWRRERKAGRQRKRRKSFKRDAPLRKQRTRP
jgi:hypothetical protein